MSEAKLESFQFNRKEQPISFIETTNVIDGVECDVYKFVDDDSKDLGIIRISKGKKTPIQKVLKGNKTIEGYMSGKGKLVITKLDNTQKEYTVNENIQKPFEITVAIGETMQWQSDKDSALIAYEICFPPYQEGRFDNQ